MDIGKVSYAVEAGGDIEMRSRFFDNNSAIGLEPTVTLIQQRNTWLKGTIRYLLSAVMAVMQKPVWQARVEWEGGHYEGPISLVTIGNGRVTGGFYMTPHADPFDGKLTFVYAYVAGRLEMLGLLPKAMKPGAGNYVEHPAVHELESPWIRITTQQPTPVHADGEIQSHAVTRIEYQILPGVLPVLVPSGS
jgi:diacylglycerol kinase family enzyme